MFNQATYSVHDHTIKGKTGVRGRGRRKGEEKERELERVRE